MPPFNNSPFFRCPQLVPGIPMYLFGQYNFGRANGRFLITNSALTSNVGTITGALIEGDVPLVGALISIHQTQAGSGALNGVRRASITAVSLNANGIGTISFAYTNANIGSVSDTGEAVIDLYEAPETIANGASIAFSVQEQPAQNFGQRTLMTDVRFPGGFPTAVLVSFQVATLNIDSDFATIGTATQITAGAYASTFSNIAQFTQTEGQYFRYLVSGLSGTSNIVATVTA